MSSGEKPELSKPLGVVGIVAAVVVVVVGGFFLLRAATKSDLDGQVVQPKAWGPPGGAAGFKVRGAPQTPASGTSAASSSTGH